MRRQRSKDSVASVGGISNKRRSTPIPVNPPRVPTPMPNTVDNNNIPTKIVLGDGKDLEAEVNRNGYGKKCPKYLDNELRTRWINPRLISKIDLEAVTSKDYLQPPLVRNTKNNNNPLHKIPLPVNTNATINSHYQNANIANIVKRQQLPRATTLTRDTDNDSRISAGPIANWSNTRGLVSSQNRHSVKFSSQTDPVSEKSGAKKTPVLAKIGTGERPKNFGERTPLSKVGLSIVTEVENTAPTMKTTFKSNDKKKKTVESVAKIDVKLDKISYAKEPSRIPVVSPTQNVQKPRLFQNVQNAFTNMQTNVLQKFHESKKRECKDVKSSGLNGNPNLRSELPMAAVKKLNEIPSVVSVPNVLSVPSVPSVPNNPNYVPKSAKNANTTASDIVHNLHENAKFLQQQAYETKVNGLNSCSNFVESNLLFRHGQKRFSFEGSDSDSAVTMPSKFRNYDATTKFSFLVNGFPTANQASAAAAFFARASQKLNLNSSPHRKKRHSSSDEDVVANGYSGTIQRAPPPVPPALLRRIGVREVTGVGKVKVMLRVAAPNQDGTAMSSNSFFSVDKRKKQVTLYDPTLCGASTAPEDRRVGVAAPKMFAFDAIFTHDDSQTEICSNALTDVIHAVINGTDGCLFCFGHAGLGKSFTMLGGTENTNALGIMPCAITWLFRGINEQKQKTGARFSVRVSAVEVCGPTNQLKDLLAGHASDSEQSPGVYLREDPVFGTQIHNHSELRAPTAERAAFYLDVAVDERLASVKEQNCDSHLLYTLHVYQYSVAGKGGVAGGRSRLHLIDLGNPSNCKATGGIPLSGLGNIILAIFNGQKHLPYKEHKLTHVLKECLGSLTCHAAMIAHVSPNAQNYVDTLTTVQLASRIHRMRRRKFKFMPPGSCAGGNGNGSSGEDGARTAGTSSEPDPSSSDLSADTVIYVGPTDDATDGEHPPVYIPSLNSGDNRCVMSKALRGSTLDTKTSIAKLPQSITNVLQQKGVNQTQTQTQTQSHDDGKATLKASSSIKNIKSMSMKSPAHVISSCKSSPARKLTGKNIIGDILSGKVQGSSDEQWIDGPRIPKYKLAEARHLMKEAEHVRKRETWIDGPLQPNPASLGYGYMDSHKKSMIKKWVENQTIQIQKTKTSPGKVPAKELKELTTFKTCEDDFPKSTSERSSIVEDRSNSVDDCKSLEDISTPGSEVKDVDSEIDDDEDIQLPPALPLIQPLSSREVSMESLDVRIKERLRSTSEASLDMEMKNYPERFENYNNQGGHSHNISNDGHNNFNYSYNFNNHDYCNVSALNHMNHDENDEILEIIEVEEPLEPVPTQDSCLQVTEEDIAMCMSMHYLNNEHPLKVLSQENLTVVSTFTDSMSVFTDLERNFQFREYANLANLGRNFHNYDYEDPDYTPDLLQNVVDETSRRKIDQLHQLHELYTERLAKANLTHNFDGKPIESQRFCGDSKDGKCKNLTRCESISLSEMLYGNVETSSIYSEPPYRPNDPTYCDNCKISMRPTINWCGNEGLQLSASVSNLPEEKYDRYNPKRFQRYCHKPYDYNLEALRHPDGASNPNLEKECEREMGKLQGNALPVDLNFCGRLPGNGCDNESNGDPKLSVESTGITTNGIKTVQKENENRTNTLKGGANGPNHPTPLSNSPAEFINDADPNLPLDSLPKIDRKTLSISSGLVKLQEGYDSGHDSTPRTSKHSPAGISRRAESGYDSVIRDSECSSIDSDLSRRSHNKVHHITLTRNAGSGANPVNCQHHNYYSNRHDTWRAAERIRHLQTEQNMLKVELAVAKQRLLIPRSRWNYELHVEGSMDWRQPGFVEALAAETNILRKRVDACKSRIMIATCFDARPIFCMDDVPL